MTLAPYAQSPVFDQTSLPDALRNEHSTKAGTWGLLSVIEGQVRLVFLDPAREYLVTPVSPAPIPPQDLHYVVTDGPVKMQVKFYRSNPLATRDGGDE